MGLLRRKSARERQEAAAQQAEEEAMHQRALRLVDTRGVIVREAEAELQAAIAAVRSYATPEREERVNAAMKALEEAKRAE